MTRTHCLSHVPNIFKRGWINEELAPYLFKKNWQQTRIYVIYIIHLKIKEHGKRKRRQKGSTERTSQNLKGKTVGKERKEENQELMNQRNTSRATFGRILFGTNILMMNITIYTDGSSMGNPGPGGYGAVLLSGRHRKELSQGYRLTTNNRMELLAVITALEALKIIPSTVTVYTDSQYVVHSVEKGWVFGWEKKNFAGKKNADLWQRFLNVYRHHTVTFKWVRGHSGNPENERCDRMAVAAAQSMQLLDDTGYCASKIDTNKTEVQVLEVK